MTKYAHLCVGGPFGGKWYVSDAPEFQMVFRSPMTISNLVPADEFIEFKTVAYIEQILHTPMETIVLWVPKDQTVSDTLRLLIAGYEANEKRKREQ